MITIQNIDFITSIIALIAAYVVSVTVCGALQALFARTLGDNAAEQAGFATLNPFQHVDILGLIALLACGLGWGRIIPLDPTHISPKFRSLRLILLYSGQTLIHLIFALFSLVTLILIFGFNTAEIVLLNSFHTMLYAHYNSLTIACALFLSATVLINLFLAAWYFVIDSFRYLLFMGLEKNYTYMRYADFLAFFGPFIVILLWTKTIRTFLLYIIAYSAYAIAYLLGIL